MDALVDSYRHFVESKIPRPAKLVGWFTLGFVQIYALRTMAKRAGESKAKAILAKQHAVVPPPKK